MAGIITLDSVLIISDDFDPSVSGQIAPIGSMFTRTTNGERWNKTGAANTDWAKIPSITVGGTQLDIAIIPQGNITSVGTVTSGTWNGSVIPVLYGGTGSSTAAGARTNLGIAIGTDVQAFDATLASLAAFNTTGILVQTAADTFAGRTLTAPAAGITITNPSGTAGNPTLVLANDLSALEGLASTGIAVRTATDTWAQRTVTGTTNQIDVSNGTGVSGNPTLTIASNPIIPGTGSITLTSGTTAQRPGSPTAAMQRYNSSLSSMEYYNGTDWVIMATSSPSAAAASAIFFDDLITEDSATTAGSTMHGSQFNWTLYGTGTGFGATATTTGVNSTDKCLGVVEIHTGTTTTGFSALTLGDTFSPILFGYASFELEWRIGFNALSTAAQEYNAYIGFIDNMQATGEPVDGIYFKYDRNTSANWVITTSSNSTRTNTTTTTAVNTVGTGFQKLRISVNSTGTSVTFYVDGTSVGTHTTNIPTGAGRFTGVGHKIEKTAGTTSRLLYADYVSFSYTFTTPR